MDAVLLAMNQGQLDLIFSVYQHVLLALFDIAISVDNQMDPLKPRCKPYKVAAFSA
jgi:hypothetical protein